MDTATASTPSSFRYTGPDKLSLLVEQALRRVVDPEIAMNIVDVGLVYEVTVDADRVLVLMTMTSAACPVADVILDEVGIELERAVPENRRIELELTWEPPWTPDRMSPHARRFMGW